MAVSEAARNIVCSGGEPLGVTNCLNFGNPYDPEVYFQFVHAIKGMGEACVKFNTPVTGGNVSFYNQNPDGPVNPTPTIGMVGLLEDLNQRMTLGFKQEGDVIYVLGEMNDDLGSSEYLHNVLGVKYSPAPHFDLETEFSLQQKLSSLIKEKHILSAHDTSEGGLFITLCESGFGKGLGFDIKTVNHIRKDAFLFGEAASRVVVSVEAEKADTFEKQLGEFPFARLGVVTSGELIIDGESWGDIESWKNSYDTSIENYLAKEEAGAALQSI